MVFVWYGFWQLYFKFQYFPGGGWLKSKIQLSSAWLGLSFAIMKYDIVTFLLSTEDAEVLALNRHLDFKI